MEDVREAVQHSKQQEYTFNLVSSLLSKNAGAVISMGQAQHLGREAGMHHMR